MKKIGRGLQFFYFFVLLFIFSTIGVNLYFFINWKLSDASYLSSIYEAEIMGDKLVKEEIPERINKLVYSDQVRSAVKLFDDLEVDVKKLSKIRKIDKQDDFLNKLNNVKKGLSKLLTFPEASSLFQVFDGKIQSLNHLTATNNWKTLARVGERIKSRILNNTDFSSKKLNSLHSFVEKSIETMRKTASGSTLSDSDKDLIYKHLDNVQVELVLWQNYLKELEVFSATFKDFEKSFRIWIDQIGPSVALEKIEIQKRNRNYLLLQFFVLTLIISLMFLGFVVYRIYRKNILVKVENSFLEIMKASLLSPKFSHLNEDFNDDFQFEIKKGHSYIQKRMTFSSIFQKGLPFPALLLNQNLKVIWANPSFCETFKISDIELDKETLGWDYIARFTNLGDSDPVLDSLKNNLSGIYQIQVRSNHNSPSLPYEMYISSIANGGQNYVMIFLYSLTFVNESIQNQLKSIIRPITKTIKSLMNDKLDDSFFKNIRDDYEKAEIIDVFDLFSDLHQSLHLRQKELLSDISKLEADLKDHYKIVNDLSTHNVAFKGTQIALLDNMKLLKKNIISYVEESSGHIDLSETMLGDLKELISRCKDFYQISKEGNVKLDEMKKIIISLDKVKLGIKPLNETLMILNNRITQNFDKILLYDGVENIDLRKLAMAIQKTKIEFDHLNKKLADFSNVLKYIDLKLSKASVVVSGNDDFEKILTSFEDEVNEYEKRAEERFFNKNRVAENVQQNEEKIIRTVEEFFSILKKNINHYSLVSTMMKNFLAKGPENFEENDQVVSSVDVISEGAISPHPVNENLIGKEIRQ